MKLLTTFFEKIRLLKRIIQFVYGELPRAAFMRDALYIIIIAGEMYAIKLGGLFIDATVEVLADWEKFDFWQYFGSDSFYWLALGLAVWMIMNSLTKVRSYLYNKINEGVTLKMDNDILRKISNENLQDVESKEFRDLLALTVSNSYGNIIGTYDAFSEFLRFLMLTITSVIILVGTVGPTAYLIPLLVLPETLVGNRWRTKTRKYYSNAVERLKLTDYLWTTATRIPFFSELRVDGTFSFLKKAYKKERKKYSQGFLDQNIKYFEGTSVWAVIGRLLMTAYVIFAFAISIAQKATIGAFKATYDYVVTAYDSAYQFINQAFIISDQMEYARYYFDYMDYEGFGDLESGDRNLPKGTPKLSFEKIDFAYPDDGVKVLENISFEIEPGDKVAFIGTDGSGKSTLLNILTGLYAITAGDYQIGDFSIRELARGELKHKISVTFENFVRYNFSLQKNITLGSEKDRLNKSLYEKAKKVSGLDKVMKKEGLEDNQLLGKYFPSGKELSPGYWQRIAIARMVYRNREIFIMDEPFTFIDGPSRAKIMENVFKFVGRDRTLIYITQDTDHLEGFDKIFYLQGGKIVEQGSLKELLRKKGKFYKEAKFNK